MAIWKKYRQGKITADAVRENILKAAGADTEIKPPVWSGIGRGKPGGGGIHDLTRYSAYPGEFPTEELRAEFPSWARKHPPSPES